MRESSWSRRPHSPSLTQQRWAASYSEARERSDALEQQQQLDAWADALEWQQRRVQVLEETQASLIARVEQSEARKVELEASLQRAAPRSAADSIPWLGSFLAAW
eukprot:CAMPEP_0181195372 /NCGR_PEP_ID=MMETSP1096-20121128/14850_1 /TAXON_ID=156174 ORGANISM="Chrysochromulina ericina, Strain CCMP281" /NCGR_SAMPLE_ID=MMETSP1096 /ASSEMBLY_ACC=CAM_ASM_000453 /LENGTH=104 /DNA_ID=CAMNT_0023284967 /DNA_START=161 /DNA_END=472 /DNA_ORIENTATION=+